MNDQDIRQACRTAAEQEGPSAELVSSTLLKMQEELEKVEAEKNAVSPLEKMKRFFGEMKPQTRWMIPAGVACAAALCLFMLRPETALNIVPVVYQEDLRMSYAYRSETGALLLPERQKLLDSALQSQGSLRRTDYQFVDFSFDEDAPVLWAAIGRYDAPVEMEVTLSNFQPALYDALSSAAPNTLANHSVYMGEDAALGDSFVLWQEGSEFVQIRIFGGAKLNDQEKKKGIEAVLQLPLEAALAQNKEL